MKLPVYLDHHATTPVDPRVLTAMLPFFSERFGNPSSRNHSYGWDAEEAVEIARQQVADLIGAAPQEIVFTSGATEANNLALQGAVEQASPGRDHLITIATEHKSVLETCRYLASQGLRVTVLPVLSTGLVDLDELAAAITDRTLLISVMQANNEIGVLQPAAEIGRMARERGVLFHSDATQGVGLEDLNVDRASIDLLSLSAHKLYGPKGVGALYVRRGSSSALILPQTHGGGQERTLRSGTLNVPGIVGFGAACALAQGARGEEAEQLRQWRDRLQERITSSVDRATVNGTLQARLPNNLSVTFAAVDGEAMFAQLPDIAVSSGSACAAALKRPSHVLRALGLSDEHAHATVRFGLGRGNTQEEIDYAADRVVEVVRALRRS